MNKNLDKEVENKILYAYVSVDLSIESLDRLFLYKIKSEDCISVGDKVLFPFGKGNIEKEGFVIEILDENDLLSNNDTFIQNKDDLLKIKFIIKKLDKKLNANNILLEIAIFMHNEYMTPLSTCLKTCMPVKRVIAKNIRTKDVSINYQKEEKHIIFNDEQIKVINDLKNSYDKEKNEHLIYGITGSGKTEVYIELIKYVISKGKKVIVLIPEISLTYQTVIRLKQVFEEDISIINSRMSDGEKYLSYQKCLEGKAKILVGPRSAIFAPFEDLGLIVIDEIHDNSYKQDVKPRYDTIDIARFRMKKQNAMLLTLSATPKVSYYYQALYDKNISIHRLTKRASNNVELPNIDIVDMRQEFKSKNKSSFSKLLKDKINEKLDKNEQIMLFMNKRGLNRCETCLDCGETIKCPHCDVALVVHNDGKAKCHYCGYEEEVKTKCPLCDGRIVNFGIGTEKLEEKCKEEFPGAKILRMDKDTTQRKGEMDKIIKDFRENKADILIGTQMIVKGHDFPNVTLVGIMCADMSLNMPSYKATEETFSILTQMEGRSGRKMQGDSIIQTYDVDNYAIKYAKIQDYDAFYDEEIKYRKNLCYPPFCKMLTCILKSINCDYLTKISEEIKKDLKENFSEKAVIFGPNRYLPYKIKDIYRRVFTIKCINKEIAFEIRNFINVKMKERDYLKQLSIVFDIE